MGAADTSEWACVLCGHCIQNDWAIKQWICIKFCIKLEHSSTETVRMIQRPQLWVTGDRQLHHDNQPAHASRLMQNFLTKHQITQETQPPYSADLVPCDFWLFPKLVSLLKGKKFQTVDEIQENTMGQLMATERTVWGPKVPTLKGTEAPLIYVQCSLYLVSSLVNISIVHSTWLHIFWTDLILLVLLDFQMHSCKG